MADLHHECGIAAVYYLPNRGRSDLVPKEGPTQTSRLISRLLLDIQNRGQLAAGMTTFSDQRNQIIDTHMSPSAFKKTMLYAPSSRRARFDNTCSRSGSPTVLISWQNRCIRISVSVSRAR